MRGNVSMLKSACSRRCSAMLTAALLIACGQQVGQQAGWGPAAVISGSTSFDAFAPEVAMDAHGGVVVVWQAWQHDTFGGLQEIGLMATRQTADGAWHEPEAVDTPPGAFV